MARKKIEGKGAVQKWLAEEHRKGDEVDVTIEDLRQIIANLHLDKKQLKDQLFEGKDLMEDLVRKYKILWAHCVEQDKLLNAFNTGDNSGLNGTKLN